MSAPVQNAAGAPRCRIGIDVGGTFTDFVLADGASGTLTRHKEPSVPSDPSRSLELGIPKLLEATGKTPADVELIVHGTTLMVNAIIQRKGARVGLVVCEGHRGLLEIGRGRLANTYDLRIEKEEPLVPRNLIREVKARLNAAGEVLERPDAAEIAALAEGFRKEGVESVAVLILHSYAYPDLELEVVEALRAEMPGIPVTASSQVWPERREFERSLVAVMNAYVTPIMETYLDRLIERMARIGVSAPVFITTSNGGTVSVESARARPIETALSGPASGVIAALRAGVEHDRLVTVDMGGTSADIAVTVGHEPEYTTLTQIGGLPLVLPVVNVNAIGAGGGSIVWVDPQGVLKVGPQSAGADPGPVCYGRGGTEATITDCYLALGNIDPAFYLGGRMPLDIEGARAALATIADKLGYTGPNRVEEAAEAALRVATAMMSTELHKSLAQRGLDTEGFALMAFGGAGAMHATLLAREARLGVCLIPPAPATFCAMGAILADVKRDYVRSVHLHLVDGAEAEASLRTIFNDLETDGRAWIESEGALLGTPLFEATCDMRYTGQAFDLSVLVPEEVRQNPDVGALTELFHLAHEAAYGFRDADSPIEITNERVRIVGKIPPVSLPAVPDVDAGAVRPTGTRTVYHDGEVQEVPVYLKEHLGKGVALDGPAVIEQGDCTIWVVSGTRVTFDDVGNTVVTLLRAAPNAEKRAPVETLAG